MPGRQRTTGARSTRRRPRRAGLGAQLGVLRVINRWRVAGFLLAAAAAIWGTFLVTSHTFDLDPAKVSVSQLRYTSTDLVRQVIDLPASSKPNVFRVDTQKMERALASLPAIARADVAVVLPDAMDVDITERTPAFVLSTPAGSFVVSSDGYVLDALPSQSPVAQLDLPVVRDGRVQFAIPLQVGGRLDDISLDADLRLLAVTPELVGSSHSLSVSLDDTNGYVLNSQGGWRAIFGHYTPNLRPVDLIDTQVQCLRSLIAADEDEVNLIYLAPQGEHCGTYVPGRTSGMPDATATPTPRR